MRLWPVLLHTESGLSEFSETRTLYHFYSTHFWRGAFLLLNTFHGAIIKIIIAFPAWNALLGVSTFNTHYLYFSRTQYKIIISFFSWYFAQLCFMVVQKSVSTISHSLLLSIYSLPFFVIFIKGSQTEPTVRTFCDHFCCNQYVNKVRSVVPVGDVPFPMFANVRAMHHGFVFCNHLVLQTEQQALPLSRYKATVSHTITAVISIYLHSRLCGHD